MNATTPPTPPISKRKLSVFMSGRCSLTPSCGCMGTAFSRTVLDPRNVQLLWEAARTYAVRRQFPAALKLFDRVLDIKPNDPDAMATKARIYQAQGNLQEAARFLSGINETSSGVAFDTKVSQL